MKIFSPNPEMLAITSLLNNFLQNTFRYTYQRIRLGVIEVFPLISLGLIPRSAASIFLFATDSQIKKIFQNL